MRVSFEVHDDEGHLLVENTFVQTSKKYVVEDVGHAILEGLKRWEADQAEFQDNQG